MTCSTAVTKILPSPILPVPADCWIASSTAARRSSVMFFFFKDTATTEIYTSIDTLSLHDALPLWHAHEMLFGFTLAVVVGFLFTAGRNWTGLPTPTGAGLAALAALWLAARVLVLTPWGWASALANVAFPLAAAAALAVP